MTPLVFAPYDPLNGDEALELFKEYPHKNFQLRLMGAAKDRVATYLEATLTESGVQSICLRDGDRLVGLVSIQFLRSMSQYFGLKMYAIKHILARADSPLVHARLLRFVMEELPDVDFLDCRVATDDIYSAHALEICDFRYVGTEIFMGKSLTDNDRLNPTGEIVTRVCEAEDQRHVIDIVRETHVHNRFVYDPTISDRASRDLYAKLVEDCFDNEQFRVLVAGEPGDVQGFIIAKINAKFSKVVGLKCGSLDFIGVRPEHRLRGIGLALNSAALGGMAARGVEFAGVRTLASNYPALKTCLASDFRISSTSLHFHRWIRRPMVRAKAGDSHRSVGTRTDELIGHCWANSSAKYV